MCMCACVYVGACVGPWSHVQHTHRTAWPLPPPPIPPDWLHSAKQNKFLSPAEQPNVNPLLPSSAPSLPHTHTHTHIENKREGSQDSEVNQTEFIKSGFAG